MAPPEWQRYRPDEGPDPDRPADRTPTPYQPPRQPAPVRSLEERTIRRVHPAGPIVLAVFALVAACCLAGLIVVIVALAGSGEPSAPPAPTEA